MPESRKPTKAAGAKPAKATRTKPAKTQPAEPVEVEAPPVEAEEPVEAPVPFANRAERRARGKRGVAAEPVGKVKHGRTNPVAGPRQWANRRGGGS